MSETGATLPRNPCRTCSRCCRYYAVPLTGHDIWRIWRSQRLRPETFVLPLEIENDNRQAIKLTADGNRFLLILDKQGVRKPSAPCIFLLTLPGEHDRCAIYSERPAACRAYPMIPSPEGIIVSPRALCPPDSWSGDDTAKLSWRTAVQQTELTFDVYAAVVAAWNARFDRQPRREMTFTDYYNFLFNVYERIATLDALLSPSQSQAVQWSWRAAPPSGSDESAPWLDYMDQIQQIVSSLLAQ